MEYMTIWNMGNKKVIINLVDNVTKRGALVKAFLEVVIDMSLGYKNILEDYSLIDGLFPDGFGIKFWNWDKYMGPCWNFFTPKEPEPACVISVADVFDEVFGGHIKFKDWIEDRVSLINLSHGSLKELFDLTANQDDDLIDDWYSFITTRFIYNILLERVNKERDAYVNYCMLVVSGWWYKEADRAAITKYSSSHSDFECWCEDYWDSLNICERAELFLKSGKKFAPRVVML